MQTSNHKKREVDLSQQISHDAEPFRIDWLSANGLASPTIPVRCVALIAFFAMEVGVHPTTFGAFVSLSGFVCSCPIALGIPPQSSEGERESGWQLGRGERLAKIVQVHLVLRLLDLFLAELWACSNSRCKRRTSARQRRRCASS